MALPNAPTVDPRIVVALDFEALAPCERLLDQLDPSCCRVKIGKELFTASGPAAVNVAHARGFEVFLDLKFHDIPATVAKAVSAAADLGVWMVNVHASGGARMLAAAAEALAQKQSRPHLIGVTVLTSMASEELNQIGVAGPVDQHALRLAGLVNDAGLDGVVCSALEAEAMRARFGADFLLVTPGIRPEGSSVDDQKRIVTPKEAIRKGSNYLVIGRPITKASEPAAVCREIVKSLI